MTKSVWHSIDVNCPNSNNFDLFLVTIGDCPVLVAKTLTIREAITTGIWMNVDNNIVKSDSQVAIGSIMGKIIAPKSKFVLWLMILIL